MALPICMTLTLLIIYIAFFIKKKLSFLHNSIVFMIITIISKNYITLMTMEFKLFKIAEKPSLFLVLILNRDIIIPLLIIICINLHFQITKWSKRIIVYLIIIGFMQMMDVLLKYFGVIHFINWNLLYALVVNVTYINIGLGISKLLFVISSWEGQRNDRNI